MRRRVLLCFVLALASGCQGGDATRSIIGAAALPSHSISDGNNCELPGTSCTKGNPDFFFLPPMVSNPSSSSNWTPGAFNGNLKADVQICALDVKTIGGVTTSTCRVSVLSPTTAAADVHGEAYQLNWKVPSDTTTFYRITVTVGAKTLGWADVQSASNASQLKNVSTNEYVPLSDGRTLPIKFRIENYALCEKPGAGPCASGTIDLAVGGTVAATLPTFTAPAGVTIPSQTPTSAITTAATTDASTTTTITVATCEDLNPRATDLPTFGKCIRVTADPALSSDGLTKAAIVFVCDVSDLTITQGAGGQVLDHDQADRITLHRLDPGPNDGQIVAALPHATACGGPTASRNDGSIRGLFAELRHGKMHEALRQVASLVSPKPLYAARFIDLGGGGSSNFFSDFQFALPAKMEVVSAADGQTATFGTLVPLPPSVKVTDIGGAPVRNATVRFSTKNGSVAQEQVVTDEQGVAQVGWTLGFTESNSLSASGRGLAGSDVNGPRRADVDPFQPIQSRFDSDLSIGPNGEVLVLSGTVSFSATGIFASSFEPLEPSWVDGVTSGFWHASALGGIRNTAYPSLVNAASGDNSAGALPAPFAGSNALWFGGNSQGNYAGQLANTVQDGGTSTAARSGVAVSPVFTVPSGPGAVQLNFESWFEIESVNPSGYDVMQVSIADLDANSSAVLARLNPSADPGGNARTPLTSGGFNLPPVWVNITRDLSAYRGHRVQLTFSFDTGDQLYNGYRGWVVDDVKLDVLASPAGAIRIPLAHADVVNTTPPPARTWHP
jgi:hypothetical protein